MTVAPHPRPCDIPGHPQDALQGTGLVSDSAWARVRAWHLHAPAERLPLPLALTLWPSAWILHAAHVPGHVVAYAAAVAMVIAWLAWRRHERGSPHLRLRAAEAAAVTGAVGGWLAAAVTSGPLGWPAHLLSWIYLTGFAAGYAWLRRHEAVRAARKRRDDQAAWTARKAQWHRIAHSIGLGGFDLQAVTPTRLGEEWLITGSPYGDLASRIAASSAAVTERLAHLEGLPYGRVEIRLTDYPGQLIIGIRRDDPAVNGPVTHPALEPDSPYAEWFPQHATIRKPIPIGVIPETGQPMELTLWDEEGGKAIGVYAMTGGGKTNMLDALRERVTAMDDAVLFQFNAAGSGDERAWEPLAALTVAGLASDDPQVATGILDGLGQARHLIGQRSETAAHTGDSVFQPTPRDPAVVILIDEIDETGRIDGASKLLEFLASKQRKAAVCLIIAGQRATATWTGGSGVRINLSTVVTGLLARDSESRHAVGAENDIPDIAEYSRGEAGFFQIWSVRQKKILARGRGFWMGNIGVQRDKIIARRDPSRRPRLAVTAPDLREDAPAAKSPAGALKARIAAIKDRQDQGAAAAPGAKRLPAGTGIPAHALAILMPLLERPEGVTSQQAGQAVGRSKSVAHDYLAALRDKGIAEMTGGGRGRRFRLARPEPPAVPQRPAYVTLTQLAQAVHDGLVPADEEQRQVLEQAWQLTRRPYLTVLHGGGGGGS
jgi:hypothetical protein